MLSFGITCHDQLLTSDLMATSERHALLTGLYDQHHRTATRSCMILLYRIRPTIDINDFAARFVHFTRP